jgi:hypothetical protein
MPAYRFMKGLLLLSAVFMMAACDREAPVQGSTRSPTSTASAASQSQVGSRPLQQDEVDNAASNKGTISPTPEVSGNSPAPKSLEPVVAVPEAAYPPHDSSLHPEEAHRLLSGTIIFNPRAIQSSNVPIEPHALLVPGQDLQVKYGSTWWAGTVLGLEKDGRVRIHYFGWADSWDELKTRAELQVDSDVRVRALDSTYKRLNR